GDEGSFDALAELCGIPAADLADPLELLASGDLVTLGTWRAWPSHPLVSEALLTSMSRTERSSLHRAAAAYLRSLGRPVQVVASHLVHTLPGQDPEMVSLLRSAGEESLVSGVPETAAAQLERALAELPAERSDPHLLALAATAHMRAGEPEPAFELWRHALERFTEPEDRATCLADLGDGQMSVGDRAAAAHAYEQAHRLLVEAGHDSSSPAVRTLLVRMGMVQALFDGAHTAMQSSLEQALSQPPEQDTYPDRQLFALGASALTFASRDADAARRLARRALGDGRLLAEDTCDGKTYYIATGVLTWADAYAEAEEAVDAAIEDSRRRGSALGFATASFCRGWLNLRRGLLHDASIDLDACLQMRSRGWSEYVEVALAGQALTHLGLGRLEDAAALEPQLRAIERPDMPGAVARYAAGVLRALHQDHEQAVADYEAVSNAVGQGLLNAAIVPWRELSVWSLRALGRDQEAAERASEAVHLARQWGAPRTVGWALRAQAHLLEREEAQAQLREAVRLFEECGSIHHLARARMDLGELLLQSDDTREEGVALLRAALAFGREQDIRPIVSRAGHVLVRHGVSVVDPATSPLAPLTPGERRVVQLAATGQTNRRIAEELFVTVKAVEWHLSNAYRKLGVTSRAQLPDVLAGTDPGRSSSEM
ncbi:MAG TPA: LuxR C-terminal-related transcriptional regulator, partial [Nocardioidaceae bacterium]|nr:LuxR C-terminal-related transcriptional regulator [Nocardioidaceae bacterium]